MIQRKGADFTLDAGNDYKDFNEQNLLNNYQKINIADHQGSHWATHLINKYMEIFLVKNLIQVMVLTPT